MSLQIYVGNYPDFFTDGDIMKLFEDFEGITFLRSKKRERKCFSFLRCVDKAQIVDVITTMHNSLVYGRNLVVRATDDNIQKYIDNMEYIPEADYVSASPPSGLNYEPLNGKSTFKSSKSDVNEWAEKYSHGAGAEKVDSRKLLSDVYLGNKKIMSSSASCITESSDYESPKRSDANFYVSVVNFPLGTSKQDLYALFEDHHPVDVRIKCNTPCRERTLTEAFIGFVKEDDAGNAILNLDNTVYRKRVILVNDANDLTVVNELLKLF